MRIFDAFSAFFSCLIKTVRGGRTSWSLFRSFVSAACFLVFSLCFSRRFFALVPTWTIRICLFPFLVTLSLLIPFAAFLFGIAGSRLALLHIFVLLSAKIAFIITAASLALLCVSLSFLLGIALNSAAFIFILFAILSSALLLLQVF